MEFSRRINNEICITVDDREVVISIDDEPKIDVHVVSGTCTLTTKKGVYSVDIKTAQAVIDALDLS
jgi:hypothetical protein